MEEGESPSSELSEVPLVGAFDYLEPFDEPFAPTSTVEVPQSTVLPLRELSVEYQYECVHISSDEANEMPFDNAADEQEVSVVNVTHHRGISQPAPEPVFAQPLELNMSDDRCESATGKQGYEARDVSLDLSESGSLSEIDFDEKLRIVMEKPQALANTVYHNEEMPLAELEQTRYFLDKVTRRHQLAKDRRQELLVIIARLRRKLPSPPNTKLREDSLVAELVVINDDIREEKHRLMVAKRNCVKCQQPASQTSQVTSDLADCHLAKRSRRLGLPRQFGTRTPPSPRRCTHFRNDILLRLQRRQLSLTTQLPSKVQARIDANQQELARTKESIARYQRLITVLKEIISSIGEPNNRPKFVPATCEIVESSSD